MQSERESKSPSSVFIRAKPLPPAWLLVGVERSGTPIHNQPGWADVTPGSIRAVLEAWRTCVRRPFAHPVVYVLTRLPLGLSAV